MAHQLLPPRSPPVQRWLVGRGRVDKDAAAAIVRQFKAVLTPVVRGLGGGEAEAVITVSVASA